MGFPSLFVHVPNTLDTAAVNSAASCVSDLIATYYTGAVWVDQKEKLLTEVDDLRMPSGNSRSIAQIVWTAMAVGTWMLLVK